MVDSVIDDEEEQGWTTNLKIGCTELKFKIDTGADISVISKKTYDLIKKKTALEACQLNLSSPGGKLSVLGKFVARTVYKGKEYNFKIVVVAQNLKSNLLSRAVAARIGVVQRIQNVEVNNKVFGPIGKVKTAPVSIKLKNNAEPYNVATPRRIAFPLQGKVKTELDKMEKSGIIEKTEEPTDWCAPIVPVPKPNGQVRICVVYKRLNRQVKRPNHMIPNLEDIAPKMVGAKFFSALDAAGGFHQIPLDEKSSYLTTFITPYGRYRYKRLPVGISLDPEAFQNKMEEILKGLEGCEPLSDDTIVHGKTEREHDKRLHAAMNRIEEAGLRLNKEKCALKRREVKYFGHIINNKGRRSEEGRVEAILNMKEPRNVSELKTVLGMMNYLSKFVPHLSTILQPISRLLKRDTTYFWGPDQQKPLTQSSRK
ncbi:Pol polyprotein [Plakobranchus ocellatus]|uniref:Pol polyprotein n=1 Tax=Plakobranchus ocellatus TaxID=259542 RepID=A0AAV4A485_9GAST|nr:Pol polyprotein [Plakobranchus ocellatus]